MRSIKYNIIDYNPNPRRPFKRVFVVTEVTEKLCRTIGRGCSLPACLPISETIPSTGETPPTIVDISTQLFRIKGAQFSIGIDYDALAKVQQANGLHHHRHLGYVCSKIPFGPLRLCYWGNQIHSPIHVPQSPSQNLRRPFPLAMMYRLSAQ